MSFLKEYFSLQNFDDDGDFVPMISIEEEDEENPQATPEENQPKEEMSKPKQSSEDLQLKKALEVLRK